MLAIRMHTNRARNNALKERPLSALHQQNLVNPSSNTVALYSYTLVQYDEPQHDIISLMTQRRTRYLGHRAQGVGCSSKSFAVVPQLSVDSNLIYTQNTQS